MYARKIAKNDASSGAYLCTAAAVSTFCVIDMGKVIFHLNRTFVTFLFAAQAGDTAICAELAHNGTLLRAFAGHGDRRRVGYDLDNSLGAALYTKTTACAFAVNNARNAIFNANCVARADICTVAKTQAAKGARTASGKQQVCGGTT